MQTLTQASEELFRRSPDECFATFDDLWHHCQEVKARSMDRWHPPGDIRVGLDGGRLGVTLGNDGTFPLNEWSYSQLCGLAGVNKATINKLSASTANQVFAETLPRNGDKPLQVLTTTGEAVEPIRAIHAASYTRLYDADLLSMVREFATDFQPPQPGVTPDATGNTSNDDDVPFEPDPQSAEPKRTGLYRGEQDMFAFLIDPTGWTEIDGEAFAPGFFLWNSEVGKRTVGIQTFWFQAVCRNHVRRFTSR